jgi:hypothetical protein
VILPCGGGVLTAAAPITVHSQPARRVYVAPSRGLNAIPAALALTPPLLDDEPIASTSQDLTLLDDLSLSAPPEPPLEPAVDVATAVEPTISGRPRRMKAKGKEKAPFVKVKDEPVTISLAQMEPLGQVTTRTMVSVFGGGLDSADCPAAEKRGPLLLLSNSRRRRRARLLRQLSTCFPFYVSESPSQLK